jgi:hypothetical protein
MLKLIWGFLSSNLTFFELNMVTKRPHSKSERYQVPTLVLVHLGRIWTSIVWSKNSATNLTKWKKSSTEELHSL